MTARWGRKVHFMANAHLHQAACGRAILDGNSTTVLWTPRTAKTTCSLCRRALGIYGDGNPPKPEKPRHVAVTLTEDQVFTLRHLIAMEQESLDEYEADGIFRGENAPTRDEYDQDLTDIELALFRAAPRI